jgi:hypothetical protein
MLVCRKHKDVGIPFCTRPLHSGFAVVQVERPFMPCAQAQAQAQAQAHTHDVAGSRSPQVLRTS